MHRSRHALIVLLVIAFTVLGAPKSARAGAPPPVEQSRLVPSLSPSFAPWSCRTTQSGPVCKGERHFSGAWELSDFPCGDTQVWARGESDRYQTRYYNRDYLDSRREFRTRDIDFLRTSPTGPATATISTNVRFAETFAVPGDDTTRTIVSDGVLWDIRPAAGPAVWRAVGTLVEPPDSGATFSGHVTAGSQTTRYENAPLTEVLSDDTFIAAVCAAATAGQ
ncbi:hypothetical protein [Phycicoccus sp. Root101]|uniref:hypothetical protein n=1 Tax=Phycicoccus sp. Root101 TaxID=1736421 RepID=UPI0007029A27|nr:hypothetical protein [Phycicoccus sp. Root101]KQU64134.1 hypothetical protein ASC58_19680 [Phycicoccus sp. Root101]